MSTLTIMNLPCQNCFTTENIWHNWVFHQSMPQISLDNILSTEHPVELTSKPSLIIVDEQKHLCVEAHFTKESISGLTEDYLECGLYLNHWLRLWACREHLLFSSLPVCHHHILLMTENFLSPLPSIWQQKSHPGSEWQGRARLHISQAYSLVAHWTKQMSTEKKEKGKVSEMCLFQIIAYDNMAV